MPKIIAVIIDLLVFLCALWLLAFLSVLLHELGHALAYTLATGDRRWHIRVGWGKRLLDTKALTVKLLVFDGFFSPSESKLDTKAKWIATLSGGPAVSLLLVLGLWFLKAGGVSLPSGFLAESAAASFLRFALWYNLFLLLFSLAPCHYFFGEVKGLESDGLQILRALQKRGD